LKVYIIVLHYTYYVKEMNMGHGLCTCTCFFFIFHLPSFLSSGMR